MDTLIRYSGRAGGAYLAWRVVVPRLGSTPLAIAAGLALGWLAGGVAGDLIAKQVAGDK